MEGKKRAGAKGGGMDARDGNERNGGDVASEEANGTNTVVTKGGTVVGRAELTREQKLRRRRREKERARKKGVAGGAVIGKEKEVESGGKGTDARKGSGAKKSVLDDLKRGGVKVIGKGGEIRDADGRLAKGGSWAAGKSGKGGAAFKL